MAVKRIRSTVDEREQKELLMDLDVVMRSNDCPYIVLFFGACTLSLVVLFSGFVLVCGFFLVFSFLLTMLACSALSA